MQKKIAENFIGNVYLESLINTYAQGRANAECAINW